jgi:hypothetical protein
MHAFSTFFSILFPGALSDASRFPTRSALSTWLDFSVFFGYFLVVVVIGFLAGRGQRDSRVGFFYDLYAYFWKN